MDGLRPEPLRTQADSADPQVAEVGALLAATRRPEDAPSMKARVRREVLRRLDEPARARVLRPAVALGLLLLGTSAAAASVTWAVVTWVRAKESPVEESRVAPQPQPPAGGTRARLARRGAEIVDTAIPSPASVALAAELPAPAPGDGLGPDSPGVSAALPPLGAAPSPDRGSPPGKSASEPAAPPASSGVPQVREAEVATPIYAKKQLTDLNGRKRANQVSKANSLSEDGPPRAALPPLRVATKGASRPARVPVPVAAPLRLAHADLPETGRLTGQSAPTAEPRGPASSPSAAPTESPPSESPPSSRPPAEGPSEPAPLPESLPEPATAARDATAARVVAVDPEVALLQSAFDAIRRQGQPARAARLAEQYLRKYPGGTLSEEALGLAVEAYAALGDRRAGVHARVYLREYSSGRFRQAAARATARFPQ